MFKCNVTYVHHAQSATKGFSAKDILMTQTAALNVLKDRARRRKKGIFVTATLTLTKKNATRYAPDQVFVLGKMYQGRAQILGARPEEVWQEVA